jgi:DnaJ-class molecular chaperone
MTHRITHTDRCKFYCKVSDLLCKLKSSTSALAERAFAASDVDERRYGWQVTCTHGGFGRTYRDPRFDTLLACPRCSGEGFTDGEPCQPCGNTGRVICDAAEHDPEAWAEGRST